MTSMRTRIRALSVALVAAVGLATGAGMSVIAGETGTEPSNVVLVFDVSNSILRSTDGTNKEFADALEGVADRIEVVADDLASGNAEISFVVFGRTAVPYPANCARLDLHANPVAIARFEACLRLIAGEYRAGGKAKVRDRVNTQDTDHVAALVEASKLLPDTSTRSAVIFFTDGEHDPPGTARDNENVVAKVTPAFAGRTPLAVLPVGLGAGAGRFESELTSIYQAFFRDMQPCEGRASFAWPQVVFPSADEAGTAVALALQEVTCSFTVAPTPTPKPTKAPPTQPPGDFDAPLSVVAVPGDHSLRVLWLAASGSTKVTDYLVRCTAASGGEPIESADGVSTALEKNVADLQPGTAYTCEVAATDGTTVGPWSAPSAAAVALGIPGTPSQPRVELLDAAAQLSVDAPAAGTTPIEQYLYDCTDTAGKVVQGAGTSPTVVVNGLANGDTFQCVAYAENAVGRSPASPATASFSPCGGFLNCNPILKYGLFGIVLVALLVAAASFWRRYQRRNRVWVTAQVDGGENRPLGWGPEIGIHLVKESGVWVAAPREVEGAPVRATYRGQNRFVVTEGKHIADVHQGDPTSVVDGEKGRHQLILRRYGDKPNDRTAARPAPGATTAPGSSELAARLPGREAAAGAAGTPAESAESAEPGDGPAASDE